MREQDKHASDSDWAEAQKRYTPALTRALGQLARKGFAAPLDEGLDLIHDFFLTEWRGVASRFDPSHHHGVPFERYLTRAFIYFARRRIINLNRWRRQLVDAALLAQTIEARLDTHEEANCEVDLAKDQQVATVRQALSELPDEGRRLLLDYMRGRSRSERSLAKELGWSRYQVREALVDAFGRVFVAVGEQGQFSDVEWQVANALWGRGQDLSGAARELKMSSAEVRTIRDHILGRMAASLQSDWRTGAR